MKIYFNLFIATFLFVLQLAAQKSFSLEEAIQYGLENSNALKLKMIASEDASAQIKEYKSIGIPKINGTVNYTHYLAVPSQPVADFITPSIYDVLFDEKVIPERDLGPPDVFKFTLFQPNQLSAGIEATSMLFDGSYLYGVKAAKLYRELISSETAVTEYTIKNNVTKAYTSILIAQENKKVIQKNIDNLTNSLNEVKALYANGFAESLDVDRLQLSYDNLNIEMDRVIQLIDISFNLLKFQMNYPSNEDLEIEDTLVKVLADFIPSNLVDPENTDFTKRPEYTVINLGQELNELDYKRTKAGYLPTARAFVSAQGSLQRQNLFKSNGTGIIPQALLGLAVNIPIYDGGEKSAKLQRIKLTQEKAALEKIDFEKSVTLQVKNALLMYNNSNKIMESRKKAVDINQKIYDKTVIKFKEGVGSSVEVSQAEASLYQAQGAYTNALYDLLSASIELKSALGN